MSFWEILFNVVAVLWSPAAITIYGFILGVILFALFLEDVYLDGVEITLLVIAWIAVSVLVWTFFIWWAVNGYNPLGWHYPIYAAEVLR